MYYTFTLLKNLPQHPAGTVFQCEGISYPPNRKLERKIPHYKIVDPHKKCIIAIPVGGALDDPEWFKKEVDFAKVFDFKCPICGETRGILVKWAVEYVCGHPSRKIYE